MKAALWLPAALFLGGIFALVLVSALERLREDPPRPAPPTAPSGTGAFEAGLELLRNGDAVGARGRFDEAIRNRPGWAEAYHNRALARMTVKDFEGARGDLDRALAARPGFREAWYNRGLVRLELGDAKGAVADYDEAVNLKSDWADAWYNRGQAKERLKDLDGAARDYVRALEVQPKEWPHHARAVAAIEALKQK